MQERIHKMLDADINKLIDHNTFLNELGMFIIEEDERKTLTLIYLKQQLNYEEF